ncbi:hypothetical protein [Microvirga guangxiensis]|uniref:hypothetical protein n=1 Tax=Microvirga guangxiensis TaxID=549386 RepID=UPI001113A8C5|nr:hypothetical protein [Microvirga guangxiensis]
MQTTILVMPLLGICSGLHAETLPQAIRLREIKDLDKLDPNWIMGMCNLPGLECNKVEVPRLFERKTETGREFYAVMVNRTLSRLAMKAPGEWQLLNRWSFEKYPLPPSEDGSEARMLDIHPALYPAGSGLWAVAVLNRITESYSGGGAEFVIADFVTLDPGVTDVGEDQRRYGNVPFSCSKTVRACFSEREYKTSPHCHNESTGYLTLKFDINPASHFHDWTATWHETSWPAGIAKSAQTKKQQTERLAPLKHDVGPRGFVPSTFAFCAGGPAG